MRAKLDELHKRFVEAGVGESTEISGQESAIISVAGNRKEDGITMTKEEKEWSERIAKEKKARSEAIALLCQALQKAGAPLLSLEIFDRCNSDCMVKATFVWGERWANISLDTPPMALFDILWQILPALR
uniref:Uncharacterized protein n=1 Tax=Siphoviridae sp. ctoRD1 TaxID=2825669 RepID=A0A8S5QG65_9CAUD|nr:MAG TPA: hypothetical protein [Siphoviridae sp. ctoRD1]